MPPGISGSLNELFDPQVVNSDQLSDRRLGRRVRRTQRGRRQRHDEDPGRRISRKPELVRRRVSTARRRSAPSGYNGQALSASDEQRTVGLLRLRRAAVLRHAPRAGRRPTPSATKVLNFHNDGTDYFGFGKLQYAPSASNVLSLEVNASQTRFAVPFDSTGGAFQNDHQTRRQQLRRTSAGTIRSATTGERPHAVRSVRRPLLPPARACTTIPTRATSRSSSSFPT